MSRGSRCWKNLFAGVALGMIALDGPGVAADMPLKAPAYKAVYNWTGFYLGGHVGYGGGSFGPGTNPLPLQGVFFPHSITGLIGGYQAGYNFQLPNNLVFGVEADVSFKSTLDRPRLVPAPFNTTLDYSATARGRVGYAFGTLLPYVTGGVAWARTHVDINDVDGSILSSRGHTHLGWTAGAGIEYAADCQMERKTRIWLHRSGQPNLSVGGCAATGRPGRPEDPHGQGRIELQNLGRAGFGDIGRLRHQATHASGVQRLERPRPDDTPSAGLSELPLAVSRCEQPARNRTRQGDLDRWRLSRMALVGRWGVLFRSGACAGFWYRGNAGPRPASPTERPKRAAPSIRSFARNDIPSARHSVWEANRKMSPMGPINFRASVTSTASRSTSGDLRSAISSTAIPMQKIRGLIS